MSHRLSFNDDDDLNDIDFGITDFAFKMQLFQLLNLF